MVKFDKGKISKISIVPIELFTRKNRDASEKWLKQKGIISCRTEGTALYGLMREISPHGTTIYPVVSDDVQAWAIFCETSCCIVLMEEGDFDALTEDLVQAELSNRRMRHHAILVSAQEEEQNLDVFAENSTNSEAPVHGLQHHVSEQNRLFSQLVRKVLDTLRSTVKNSNFPIEIKYVFGLYCILGQEKMDARAKSLLKILAEPSILDKDDMLASAEEGESPAASPEPEHRLFARISDVDVSSFTTTYITWAGVVSYSMDKDAYARTKDLVVCLEVRLQTIWNRCLAFRMYADDVFVRRTTVKNFDQIYWHFVRAFDDAKSAISSTFSTRASELFAEMIKTSRLDGEIDRLQMKLELVEKFLDQRRMRQNTIYQRTIEVLLFVAAICSIVDILLPTPVILDQQISWSIVSVLSLLGILAILRLK